jgi:hypothetical protein
VRTFLLEVELENDAFSEESAPFELARILSAIARELSDTGSVDEFTRHRTLRDYNGNPCGSVEIRGRK